MKLLVWVRIFFINDISNICNVQLMPTLSYNLIYFQRRAHGREICAICKYRKLFLNIFAALHQCTRSVSGILCWIKPGLISSFRICVTAYRIVPVLVRHCEKHFTQCTGSFYINLYMCLRLCIWKTLQALYCNDFKTN
jgi:hypothetical protein